MGQLAGMLKRASQIEFPSAIAWGPQLDPNSRPGMGETIGTTLGGQVGWMGVDALLGRSPLRGVTNPLMGGLTAWLGRTGNIPFTNIHLFRGEADRQRNDAYNQGFNAGWASPLAARFAGRRHNG